MSRLLLVCLLCVTFVSAAKFTVKFKGNVTCQGRPYEYGYVQMYKKEGKKLVELKKTAETDSKGNFVLQNTATSNKKPVIFIKIGHGCLFSGGSCVMTHKLTAPVKKIFKGKKAKEVYNFGTIKLDSGGEVECQPMNNPQPEITGPIL